MAEQRSRRRQIEAITAALQDEIGRASQKDTDSRQEADPLRAVRERQWVNSHLPIGWPEMPKGLGPKLLAFAQKITRRLLRWYVDPVVEQQNRFNAAVAEALGGLHSRSSTAERQLQEQISANYGHLQHHASQLAALLERHRRLNERFTQFSEGEQLGRVVRREFQALASEVSAEHERIAQQLELARLRLQRVENWYRHSRSEPRGAPDQSGQAVRPSPEPAFDYYLLGIKYRSEAQIAERLTDYDDLFQELTRAQQCHEVPALPILDIGCGRGDLIAHLGAMGLSAYGIEVDPDAVQMAQDQGRDARLVDMFAHLSTLEDESLAAITLVQVIEHLATDELVSLFAQCRRKLAPGGFVIAETINPHCLEAVMRYYLMDPSHRSLLPPQLTQLLLEHCGMVDCQTRFLRPVPDPVRLEALRLPPDEESKALQRNAVQRNIDRLNDILYGPQDYAVIAYRPEE